ncbi:MAG: ATP-binding protein, partial [Nocardioidaceae bacterium]
TFLGPLLGISSRSDLGSLLSEILEPRYLSENGITRLGALLTHLERDCELQDAQLLARRIRVFASKDFGRCVFDETLPPLPTDSAGIVIRTHTLELPSRDELTHRHLYDELSLEKIYGRAIYALGTNMARWISASDRSRLAAFPVDEFHDVGTSPEAIEGVKDIIRKGRKEKTVAILGTQNPGADYEDSSIRGLVPTRVAMRTESPELAAEALRWLGLDPEDRDLIEILTRETSPYDSVTEQVLPGREGEAFMRDASGNVGRLKVDLPALPGRAQACLTTPEERAAQLEAVGAR